MEHPKIEVSSDNGIFEGVIVSASLREALVGHLKSDRWNVCKVMVLLHNSKILGV